MSISRLLRNPCALLLSLGLVSLAPSTSHAAGVSPAKATPVQREQAQSRFIKGRELYNAKKYEAALAQLRASLDIVASPNTRLYIGRCLRDMGRTVEAYVELGRAAVEAKELVNEDPRYEQAAGAANEERAQLQPKLGFVEVGVTHAGPSTTLRVAGDEVRRGGWAEPVPVVPGNVDVVVETPGQPPIMQSVAVRAGEHKQVAIDAGADAPTPAEAPAPATTIESNDAASRAWMRPVAFAAGGIAVAGLATFVAAGVMANGTYSDLEKACGDGPCPPGHEGDVSSGKTQQTFANVGLGVFAVAAAAGVTLFVLSTPKRSTASVPAGPTARLTAGPSFVTIHGAF